MNHSDLPQFAKGLISDILIPISFIEKTFSSESEQVEKENLSQVTVTNLMKISEE